MPVPSRSSRLLVTLLVAVPWIMVGVQWFVILPRYARLFDQYGLKLPHLSEWLIAAVKRAGETFLISGWILLLCLMLSMFRVHRLMKADLPAKTRNRRLFAVFAIPLTLFLLAWLGVAHPHAKLIEGLGK